MKRTAIIAAIIVSYAQLISVASAETGFQNRAIQYALKKLGYYEGKVDGMDGPGTRKAIAALAVDSGTENSFWPVASVAAERLNWRIEWDDRIQKSVDRILETELLDYGSAKVLEKMAYRDGRNISACVRFNAKNNLGAYTGYQWLLVHLVDMRMPFISTDADMVGLGV